MTGRLGWYLLIASSITMAVIGAIALLTNRPWVFPSLGPTIFIVFTAPLAAAAAPRNVFTGHLIGILAGLVGLVVFGLYGEQFANLAEFDWRRIGTVVVALALTVAVMTWLGIPHAPAAATTLIVALGLLTSPADLIVMMLSVVAVIVAAWIINFIHGDRMPLWAPSEVVE